MWHENKILTIDLSRSGVQFRKQVCGLVLQLIPLESNIFKVPNSWTKKSPLSPPWCPPVPPLRPGAQPLFDGTCAARCLRVADTQLGAWKGYKVIELYEAINVWDYMEVRIMIILGCSKFKIQNSEERLEQGRRHELSRDQQSVTARDCRRDETTGRSLC